MLLVLFLTAPSALAQEAPPKEGVIRDLARHGDRAIQCRRELDGAWREFRQTDIKPYLTKQAREDERDRLTAIIARTEACAKDGERAFADLLPVLEIACGQQGDEACRRWAKSQREARAGAAVAVEQQSSWEEAAKGALARLAEARSITYPKYGQTFQSQREDEKMFLYDLAEATRRSQAARVGAAAWRERVTFVPLEDPVARAAAEGRRRETQSLAAIIGLGRSALDAADAGQTEQFRMALKDFAAQADGLPRAPRSPELRDALKDLRVRLGDLDTAWRRELGNADRVAYLTEELRKPAYARRPDASEENLQLARRRQAEAAADRPRLIADLRALLATSEGLAATLPE